MRPGEKVAVEGGPMGCTVYRRLKATNEDCITLAPGGDGGEFFYTWEGLFIAGPRKFEESRIGAEELQRLKERE